MKRTVLIVAIAALCIAGSAVAEDRSGQYLGSGGRADAAGQTLGSGGVTTQDSGGYLGSGNVTAEASGGLIGSGTRSEDGGQVIGSGGYLGSGLSVRQLRLSNGSSLLVVSWDEGMFVIPIEE